VLDGSISPRSLGVNPLLTISALAERGAHLIAADNGWTVVERPAQRDPLDVGAPQPRTALWFTERLTGFVSTKPEALADPPPGDPNAPHVAGAAAGRKDDSICSITVTIRTPDIDAFSKDPEQEAEVMGTVEAPAIDPNPMTVDRGRFNLLVPVGQSPAYKRMHYRLPVVTTGGRRLFFEGHKEVQDDPGVDVVADTTTLYVTIHEGEENGPVMARGVIVISPADFARQLRTLDARGPDGSRDLGAIATFGRMFAKGLWGTHGLPGHGPAA
jgi:cholesterol oxidase